MGGTRFAWARVNEAKGVPRTYRCHAARYCSRVLSARRESGRSTLTNQEAPASVQVMSRRIVSPERGSTRSRSLSRRARSAAAADGLRVAVPESKTVACRSAPSRSRT